MKRVLLRAPLLSISGYGVHSRQIFKWLAQRRDVELFTNVVQWGDTSWMIDRNLEGGIIGQIMDRSRSDSDNLDVSIQVQLPDEWDPKLARRNIGVTALVEADVCNPKWVESCNRMSDVVVPSSFSKRTLLATGNVTTPVTVIPEWYKEEIDDVSALDVNFDTSFNFLVVSQFTGSEPNSDRKNIFNTIRWFCESFKGDDDVGLIIKTNHGRGTLIDRETTRNMLRKTLGEVRTGRKPKIHLLHGNMTEREVASLYRHPTVKCLINLTRGEGFGLPLLEAAVSEVPIIATNWSGHLDFLNLGKFISVDYNLINIPESRLDGRIFVSGMKWADPIESDFKRRLEKFKKSPNVPKEWAQELSQKLRSQFSRSTIQVAYDNLLDRD